MRINLPLDQQEELGGIASNTVRSRKWTAPTDHFTGILVSICCILGIGAGCIITLNQVPTYEATATALLRVEDASNVADLSSGSSLAEQLAPTYAKLATSPRVAAQVRSDLGNSISVNDLINMVSASSPNSTAIVQISTKSSEQSLVAPVANMIVATLNKQVESDTRTRGRSNLVLDLQGEAQTPTRPSGPSWLVNAIIGLTAGIFAAGSILALRRRAAGRDQFSS